MWSSSSNRPTWSAAAVMASTLLEDVEAVGLLLHQPLDATRLALDAPQPLVTRSRLSFV